MIIYQSRIYQLLNILHATTWVLTGSMRALYSTSMTVYNGGFRQKIRLKSFFFSLGQFSSLIGLTNQKLAQIRTKTDQHCENEYFSLNFLYKSTYMFTSFHNGTKPMASMVMTMYEGPKFASNGMSTNLAT